MIALLDVRDAPLSVEEVLAAVADPAAGGVVSFTGLVRTTDGGREVASLSYSAHPSALAELQRVAEAVVAELPVVRVAALHRVGDLEVGDVAVVVAASAAHRDEAFVAARRLIDDLKATVPIWKDQRFTDGTQEWVGSP
ncbi:MAG TPA: molybdenum cofactor biosynthesis protein MoaE [Mycobacteriales bacterium]|nr:molybdenum cofactor biosynthesis protein MoaE [Mycobacteriales bacterium]